VTFTAATARPRSPAPRSRRQRADRIRRRRQHRDLHRDCRFDLREHRPAPVRRRRRRRRGRPADPRRQPSPSRTITIHAGATGGVSSTFTLATNDSVIGATFTNDNNYDLDNTAYPFNPAGAAALYGNAQPGAFTVTTSATPEPAILAGIVLLPLLARRRR